MRSTGAGWLAAALLAVGAGAPAAGAERITVVFVDPERFAAARLEALARAVRAAGEVVVPAGLALEVRVVDLDLAGEFEPVRAPAFERVRVMRGSTPPRIDLEFQLTDARGGVVTAGHRSLRDPCYLNWSGRLRGGGFPYEEALLVRWLRQEFGR